jgi:serine/threonine protein kinase
MDAQKDEVTPKDLVILNDRWRVERYLGSGGAAAVFEATEVAHDGLYAIKILTGRSNDDELCKRFVREAMILYKVSHPNIVRFVDFNYDNNSRSYYIVMERLHGPTLREYLDADEGLRMIDIVRLARLVTAALAEVHSLRIIHRDLKPENLSIQTDPGGNLIKVFDFGLSKLETLTLDALTRPGKVYGTAAYLSPEQAGGSTVDHRTDLYALGVILYELLSGGPPFSGNTLKVLDSHVNTQPAPLNDRWALEEPYQIRFASLVMWLLAKSPDRRPVSADVVARELAGIHREIESDSRYFTVGTLL